MHVERSAKRAMSETLYRVTDTVSASVGHAELSTRSSIPPYLSVTLLICFSPPGMLDGGLYILPSVISFLF